MKEMIEFLKQAPLSREISKEGMQTMLDCFSAELLPFHKGARILGKKGQVGWLLEGRGLPQETFFPMPWEGGEAVVAETDGRLLVLDGHMLLYPCYGCCPFHARLLENMRQAGIDFHGLEGTTY